MPSSTLVLLLIAQVVVAGEVRLSRHPHYTEEVELARLERLGSPEVRVSRPGAGVFEVDASDVVKADLRKLLQVSLDFERYAEMRVPNVVRSHVVSASRGAETLVTWTRMKYGLFSSHQYLQVREYLEPERDGFGGSAWSLYHPEEPSSGLRDRPLFDRFDGSWYIEPLEPVPAEAGRPIRLYLRYFVRGDFKWWVPPPVIRRISREGGILETDTIRFLRILTCNEGADADPARCVPK